MSKLYRTTTVAVGSHGKKGKKDRYSGNRACKETGQKHAFCDRKVDKYHLVFKGKTSLRPLPLFNTEKQEEERKDTGNWNAAEGKSHAMQYLPVAHPNPHIYIYLDIDIDRYIYI